MYDYQAYGLWIHSQLRLFQLPVWDSPPNSSQAITISLGLVNLDSNDESLPYPYLKLENDEVIFEISSLGRYQVRFGNEIIVDPAHGADETLIQAYLVGAAMAILLNQRGRLVLHGSAVNINGYAIAFLGSSGMGKSSTAAAMLARGHELLVDDIIAIEFSQGDPLFYPGFPHIKLAPEASRVVRAGELQLRLMDEFDEKFNYRLLENSSEGPVEIKQIYILSEGSSIQIERIPVQEAVIEMVRYSMPISMVHLNRSEHLNKCIRLASSVDCYFLKRPLSLEMLPQVAKRVEEHLR